MKVLLQRVRRAAVSVDGEVVGAIASGFLALVGVADGDTEAEAELLASRTVNMRVFSDDDGKMNLSVADAGGGILVVSQFTLMGDTRRGRRPSFVRAAAPDVASALVDCFADSVAGLGIETARGRFGADMQIDLVADGPVTLMLDSSEKRRG